MAAANWLDINDNKVHQPDDLDDNKTFCGPAMIPHCYRISNWLAPAAAACEFEWDRGRDGS
jgi:hypothetical protein